MAPKSKSDDFGKILKSGQKVLKKVSKAAQLAKGAKGIIGRAKEAAGESKCKTKSCTLKERLQDFAERAIRGGKSLFGEREKIKSMAEEGKRLISGESSKKSKMMKPKKQQESKPKKQDPSPSTPPQAPPAPRAPPAPTVSSQSKPDRSQLNAQIKKGYQLKKVQKSEKKNSGELEDNLTKQIEKAMKNRRRQLKEDDD